MLADDCHIFVNALHFNLVSAKGNYLPVTREWWACEILFILASSIDTPN